jgi:hypothetical protein
MSYEGYTQLLCEKGHYFTKDCWEYDFTEDIVCPTCKSKVVWENGVNTTNGSFEIDSDGNENRIDGYVDLEEKTPAVFCTCKECGVQHLKEEATYKIPEVKEM